MHFLIATAALLSAAILATASPLIKISIGPPPPKVSCRIIGQAPVIVRDCPSRDCDEMARYTPGQLVDFYCYLVGADITNPYSKETSAWWDYSADGFFPDVYVEESCAAKITKLCKVCL